MSYTWIPLTVSSNIRKLQTNSVVKIYPFITPLEVDCIDIMGKRLDYDQCFKYHRGGSVFMIIQVNYLQKVFPFQQIN